MDIAFLTSMCFTFKAQLLKAWSLVFTFTEGIPFAFCKQRWKLPAHPYKTQDIWENSAGADGKEMSSTATHFRQEVSFCAFRLNLHSSDQQARVAQSIEH